MLVVEGVSKTYPAPRGLLRVLVRSASKTPVEALKGVSMKVEAGEIVGLVGPNGAGKTTLLKSIATLLQPTEGTISVGGHDTVSETAAVLPNLGVFLAEERSVYWRISGYDNLVFFGVLSGLPPAEAKRRARGLLEAMGLADRDKRVLGYSSGMRAALNLARVLIHDPKVLLLDEPTRSLDPIATENFHEQLLERSRAGTAVVLSSHRLDEVEAICSRIVVVVGGRIRYEGSVAGLSNAEAGLSASVLAMLREPDPS